MIRSAQKKRSKKISFIDFVLLLSSKLIDLYQEIRDPFNLISGYYYYNNQSFTPDDNKIIKRYKNFLYQLKKRNYLQKESDINKCHLILTKKAKYYLRTKYPKLYFNKKNWDKKMRLVIFDVQEVNRLQRNRLRKFLRQIGFVMLQKSVWLSPYNQLSILKKWLNENRLKEKILLIEAQKINIKNKDKIINQFW